MTTVSEQQVEPDVLDVDRVTIRFAGDSGDGMQLTGTQFTKTSAVFGNDISTVPDIPAEIRAPQGSLPGVSAFQVSFSSFDIYTPGDRPDVLVAMNPAALKVHLPDLPKGGIVIVNTDEFNETNLKKAGYDANPLHDNSLQAYRLFEVAIGTLNSRALQKSRPLGSGGRSLEEHVRARPHVLDVQPSARHHNQVHRGPLRQAATPRLPKPTSRLSRRATTTARPPRCSLSTITFRKRNSLLASIATSPATRPPLLVS